MLDKGCRWSSLVLICMIFYGGLQTTQSQDLSPIINGMERRYASVQSATGHFKQTYRAPGIEQVESGVFWLKKPGLMRWEYDKPEEKLFIADGRECFLYVPQDRQVTVQPLSVSDLRSTPLAFLLGEGNISQSYSASRESEFRPVYDHTLLIRLTPRKYEEMYVFLVLELDDSTYEIRRVALREHNGNTSEFLLSNVATNIKVEQKQFRFTPPRGVEVLRLTDNK
jgi:outer membrane lipoprotein carrier protein